MIINVQYTTQLRAALGRSDEKVEFNEDATLQMLLATLSTRHPEAFSRFVWDSDQRLLPNLIVTVGDQQVTSMQQRLGDGDTVTLLSAISGG